MLAFVCMKEMFRSILSSHKSLGSYTRLHLVETLIRFGICAWIGSVLMLHLITFENSCCSFSWDKHTTIHIIMQYINVFTSQKHVTEILHSCLLEIFSVLQIRFFHRGKNKGVLIKPCIGHVPTLVVFSLH